MSPRQGSKPRRTDGLIVGRNVTLTTEPLPSNDKGTFTEPLPSNDRGIHTQTHRLMGGIF
jgi:hypothetical protein